MQRMVLNNFKDKLEICKYVKVNQKYVNIHQNRKDKNEFF